MAAEKAERKTKRGGESWASSGNSTGAENSRYDSPLNRKSRENPFHRSTLFRSEREGARYREMRERESKVSVRDATAGLGKKR